MQSTVRIIVDKREKASEVPRLLKTLGMKIEYRMLVIGDYILFQGYVVERKEVHDFVNSLFSGRLFNQAAHISENYEKAVLIVEGDLQSIIAGLSNQRILWGALIAIAFSYNLRIFFTYNSQQTAEFIYTLAKQQNHAKNKGLIIYKKQKTKTLEEMKLAILSSLPGIGPKLAKNMLYHFGSLRKIFSASVAELALVNRIGKAKAEKIIQVLDSKQKPLGDRLEQTIL